MIERSYYTKDISAFLVASESQILGELANRHYFALEIPQKNAWIEQIACLKQHLRDLHNGHIFFEFAIPRMGKRVDVLLVVAGVIFVLEFKVGAESYDRHAIDQVMDYALDLKNFHEGSHDRYIVPILISTKAGKQKNTVKWSRDCVAVPLLSQGEDLRELITQALCQIAVQNEIDADKWASQGYKPTPTIVEAAQALYRDHSVDEISRSDAGATNLTTTNKCITEIIDFSKRTHRKSICFVTGSQARGKPSPSLNISIQRFRPEEQEHAVFLSGNGPWSLSQRSTGSNKVARTRRPANGSRKETLFPKYKRSSKTFIISEMKGCGPTMLLRNTL